MLKGKIVRSLLSAAVVAGVYIIYVITDDIFSTFLGSLSLLTMFKILVEPFNGE